MKDNKKYDYRNVYIFSLFVALIAPTFYIYTNCAVADKVADMWESDPISSRHKNIALQVLRKYRKLYVDIFPYFVQDAKNNIYLGRAGNTTYNNHHYSQVLDCIDDAIDAYNEESGSANLYYFNDDERIFGIDNDEGASGVAEGNAIFIPESYYEDAIDSFVDDPYVIDKSSLMLFQLLVHEFNHWNGISHQNEMQATHADFIDFTIKDREKQLVQFYNYSDSSYYFELGPLQTISGILYAYSRGYSDGSYAKDMKCTKACKEATTELYTTYFPTVWNGDKELDWYGINESEFSSMAEGLCTNVLIDSSAATDPMNVCSRESNIEAAILDRHDNLCYCQEVDEELLGQVLNIDISGQNVTSIAQSDFYGLGENLTFKANNNQITSLDSELFAFVESAYSIEIQNNQISTIDPDAFSNLTGLVTLDLSGNQISSLTNSRLFKDLRSLQSLYLQNNNISTIDTNMFNNLQSLVRINLSNNSITSLPTDFFNLCSTSSRLTDIYLTGNSFSTEDIATYRSMASTQCPSVNVDI